MSSQAKLQNVACLQDITTIQNEVDINSKINLKQAISLNTEHNEIKDLSAMRSKNWKLTQQRKKKYRCCLQCKGSYKGLD